MGDYASGFRAGASMKKDREASGLAVTVVGSSTGIRLSPVTRDDIRLSGRLSGGNAGDRVVECIGYRDPYSHLLRTQRPIWGPLATYARMKQSWNSRDATGVPCEHDFTISRSFCF